MNEKSCIWMGKKIKQVNIGWGELYLTIIFMKSISALVEHELNLGHQCDTALKKIKCNSRLHQ